MVETSSLSGLRVDEILAEFFTRKLEEKDKLLKQSHSKKSKSNNSTFPETKATKKDVKHRKEKKKHKKHKKKYKKERRRKSDTSERDERRKKHKAKKRRYSELCSENQLKIDHHKKFKLDKLFTKSKNIDRLCVEDCTHVNSSELRQSKENLQRITLDKLNSVLSEIPADCDTSKLSEETIISHLEETDRKAYEKKTPILPKSGKVESKIEKHINLINIMSLNPNNILNDKVKAEISIVQNKCDIHQKINQGEALPSIARKKNSFVDSGIKLSKPEVTENSLSDKVSELFTKGTVPEETDKKKKLLQNADFISTSCDNRLIKRRGKIIIKDLKSSQIMLVLKEKEKCQANLCLEVKISNDSQIPEKCPIHDFNESKEMNTTSVGSDSKIKTNEAFPDKSKRRKSKHRHKHKRKKEKNKVCSSRGRSSDREKKRKYDFKARNSKSPSPKRPGTYDSREKIDKARLLEIARRNLLTMIEKGTLPKGINLDALKQEQLVSIKSGGKSVQELTDFCRTLSQKERECLDDGNMNKIQEEESEQPFIHHPFKLRDPQPVIKLNIKNAVQLPVKSHAEKAADAARLRLQFPVSSGSQHRQKELEWIPVDKADKDSDNSAKEPEPQPKTTKHTGTKTKSSKKDIPAIEEIIIPASPPKPITTAPIQVLNVASSISQPVSTQPEQYPNFPDQVSNQQ